MCTIFIAYKMHPKYDLIYLGNRDEFKQRPTHKTQFYEDVLMGKDLEKGGTWMGITKKGRFACLTNYRDMTLGKDYETSRGDITYDFLKSQVTAENYLETLKESGQTYKGYNLILGDMKTLHYYTNITDERTLIKPGVYGLSNHFLDTPWHKVNLGKTLLTDMLYDEIIDVEGLFNILNNTSLAEMTSLPDTGLPTEIEHALSAMHIDETNYGTVFKQVILVEKEGHVHFYEKTLEDQFHERYHIEFDLE